jgi:hypothetical protein
MSIRNPHFWSGSKNDSKALDRNGTQWNATGQRAPETWDTGTKWDTTEQVAAIL